MSDRSYDSVYYLLVFVLCVSAIGCSEMKVAPVSGTVTLDGKPLERASVLFQPKAGGRPSNGVTDKNGFYRLGYSMNEEGAEVGSCIVKVSTALPSEQEGSKRAKELVPTRYAKDPIVVEVASRSNTIDLSLTSADK
ncbi:MAG TPA: carboxypeptidase-like regulatory domain-containing protein [Pirellula sp.]|nr:carboxypeptidase-like regulatory domain-containing protein [Pirellula sp.]